MNRFKPGEVVTYVDKDKQVREQEVRLVRETMEPKWANEPVWLFEAVADGAIFGKGEQSYARPEDLER